MSKPIDTPKLKFALISLWNEVKKFTNNCLVNAEYNENTRTFTFTKKDNTLARVVMPQSVNGWGDMEFCTYNQSSFVNLVPSAEIFPGILDADGGSRPTNADWRNIRFRVQPGKTYRAITLSHTGVFVTNPMGCHYFDENHNFVEYATWDRSAGTILGQYNYAELTVPNDIDSSVVYASFNLRITGGYNEVNQLMIWDTSTSNDPTEYIQRQNGAVHLSDDVTIEFNSLTGLQSQTLNDAIDELHQKLLSPFTVGEYRTLAYDTSSVVLNNKTWLKCDGRAVSKSNYPSLYNLLGDTYGEGAITFNLPPNQQSQGYLYICAE